MKSNGKKNIVDAMTEHKNKMDALWTEIEPMVIGIEISDYDMEDYYAFENRAETLMRLFFLSAGIKPSETERFDLLYEVFARYLMRQRRILDATTKERKG